MVGVVWFLNINQQSWSQEIPEIIQQANPYINNQKLSYDNLLVLQINLGNFLILDEPIIGYAADDQIFLSLKDFVRVLELPITLQPDNMGANGWFISKDKKISLDLNKNQCLANGKKFTTSPDDMVVFGDDIFVNIKTLQKWFGLDFDFTKQEQEIKVRSGGLLPVEERFERQQKWQKLTDEEKWKANKKDDYKDTIKTPYKIAAVPFGDLSYGQNYNKSNHNTNSSSQLNGLFTGDFLYLNNQIFATVQDGALSSARIKSGRKDADGNLLGPLGATEFSLGDINTPEQPLIARSGLGKGALISNYPPEYVNQFNKVSIRGNAQADWDVEIYRNDSLFNFQKVSSDGIYEFLDVPLVSGLNIIKLIFYGPFGQQYQETRRFMVGNDLLQENKIYYRFAANKNNDNLISAADQDTSNDKSQGVGRFFGEVGYGLTKSTSIVANFLRVPVQFSNQQSDYTNLGLMSSFLGVAGKINLVRDLENKSNAQEISLQTEFFDYSLSTTFNNFDTNFVSENNPQLGDPLIHKTSIRLDGPLKIPFMSFPSRISFAGSRDSFDSGEYRDSLDNEISLGLSNRLSLTQAFQYITDSRIDGDSRKTITARTLLNYSFSAKLTIRSSLAYNLQPTETLNTLNMAFGYNFGNNFNTNFSVDHQFAQAGRRTSTNYSASLSKTFKKIIVSLGGNYIDSGNFGANINLSTSFGYDAKHNTGVISGIPIANGGAIAIKVFIDENNNGLFDKGEEPLKDVEILINGGVKKIKTNQDGVAFIANLQIDNTATVTIDNNSLPDPYLFVKKNIIKVSTHSGTIADIDFPIIKVGEIYGYAVINKNGNISPAANVELQLVDEQGNIISSTKSSYDGFYLLETIPFGNYQLKISPQQSARLGFAAEQKYDIELNHNHQTIEKMNFEIKYENANKIHHTKKHH